MIYTDFYGLIAKFLEEKAADKAKQKTSTRSYFTIACILVCVAGLVYHFEVITEEYLEYKTVTATAVYNPDSFDPPAVSICVPLGHFKSYRYLIDFRIDINDTIRNTFQEKWESAKLTVLIHQANKIPHSRDAPFVKYFWQPEKEPNVVQLLYNQITTHYLKSPFESNCYDYVLDDKLASRGDCREKCIKDGILKKYGKVGRCQATTIYDRCPCPDYCPSQIDSTMDISIKSGSRHRLIAA